MKVISAGCSFSDYLPNNNIVWGEVLAEILDAEYIHEGSGCGSNFRIWRRIPTLILNETITSEDLLFIQYTDYIRNEFWTISNPKEEIKPREVVFNEPYHTGSIIKYKTNSHQWQRTKKDSEFFKMYEEYHVNEDFCREQFHAYHFMFQHMLLSKNIRTVFLHTKYIRDDKLKLIPHFDNTIFPYWGGDGVWYSEEDDNHLSDEGHKDLARKLYQHLINISYVK